MKKIIFKTQLSQLTLVLVLFYLSSCIGKKDTDNTVSNSLQAPISIIPVKPDSVSHFMDSILQFNIKKGFPSLKEPSAKECIKYVNDNCRYLKLFMYDSNKTKAIFGSTLRNNNDGVLKVLQSEIKTDANCKKNFKLFLLLTIAQCDSIFYEGHKFKYNDDFFNFVGIDFFSSFNEPLNIDSLMINNDFRFHFPDGHMELEKEKIKSFIFDYERKGEFEK